ncbi:uncharacterized protein [Argopecten irradians]|uniref:uncharacterized protein n=1 Tax=Argopecten irradians TaxID=31199 RepID=UPI003719E87C
MFLLCILIIVSQGFVDCVVDCNGKTNGNYEITCHSYTHCSNGIGTLHTCPENQMYNMVSQTCGGSSSPCNIIRSCGTLPDKRYPDLETNCRTYYTCQNNIFYGHNFCNPGLVFDESSQFCNWPHNVAQPCGTAPIVVG